MKFGAKNLSPVAFHALTCAEVSVSIQCFDWSKMAAEGFPGHALTSMQNRASQLSMY